MHGHAVRQQQKHLTRREKSQIRQAHAKIKSSLLSTHASLHPRRVVKVWFALQSADLSELLEECAISGVKSH